MPLSQGQIFKFKTFSELWSVAEQWGAAGTLRKQFTW